MTLTFLTVFFQQFAPLMLSGILGTFFLYLFFKGLMNSGAKMWLKAKDRYEAEKRMARAGP